MDIVKALSFIPEEDRYVEKLAIGTGLVLVSYIFSVALVGVIGFFILAGYGLRLFRNVQAGKSQVLPEWDDWSGDLTRGFKWTIVGVIWSLPAVVFAIPMAIGGGLVDGYSEAGQVFGVLLLVCMGTMTFLYSLFVALITPGYTIAFARDERISSGLQLTPIWQWTRANIGQVIVAALAIFIVSFGLVLLAMLLGTLACFIGLVVTMPLVYVVIVLFQSHLYGQLARSYPFDGVPAPVAAPGPAAPAPAAPPAQDAGVSKPAASEAPAAEVKVTYAGMTEEEAPAAPSDAVEAVQDSLDATDEGLQAIDDTVADATDDANDA